MWNYYQFYSGYHEAQNEYHLNPENVSVYIKIENVMGQ